MTNHTRRAIERLACIPIGITAIIFAISVANSTVTRANPAYSEAAWILAAVVLLVVGGLGLLFLFVGICGGRGR